MSHADIYVGRLLPRSWPAKIRIAVVNSMALVSKALLWSLGRFENAANPRARLAAQVERLKHEIALLTEEIRIKDTRMQEIEPRRRPHYPPSERMAILELRALRGWSLSQAAARFLVKTATVSSWTQRLDEKGPNGLVQLQVPVNRFPDFVRYMVQRLKTLCPVLGKARIARMLARAGLHLGRSTVGRILAAPKPAPAPAMSQSDETSRIVTARYPNHIWHVDLTLVPTRLGFWVPWLPFALTQRWPFCWWIGR